MAKLSVVLATFNEEKNLGKCLESLKDIADEIVIVDGTSTDRTVEIAKEYGARVKVTTNKPNFHINKQMAIDMAKGDWILQMDADEHTSEELKDEIRKILKQKDNEYDGYWMPRKNYFLGKFLMKGGQYPDYTLRLYRKGKGYLPQKDVHEQAVVEGKVGYLKHALLHYPYEDLSHYVRKWDKYNDFYAEQIKEEQKGKNIFLKIFYAFAYLILRPAHWFLTTYFRHKGFVDSWQGFTFSLFSALRFPVSYIKYVGPFNFAVWVIIILAALIRFYDYPSRWGLGGDDARDALIGMEALKRGEMPLMGPFSSAGPFVFGGIFYWFIMLSYFFLPFMPSAPWVFLGIVSVLTVLGVIYLGKEVGGKGLGVIMGLLAATAPQMVARTYMLGPHTFIPILSTLMILCFFLLWRTKKLTYAILVGFFLGLALNFHYQAINLILFLPAIFFITSLKFKDKVLAVLLSAVGFIIPSAPLIYWDAQQGFANYRNIADYFLVGQYRLYVPNSWRIFLIDFIPNYWSFVVGRFPFVGAVLVVASGLMMVYNFIKKKLPAKLIVILIIFAIQMLLSRYYKGERSEGYMLYLFPIIMTITGWLFYQLIISKNKIIKYFGYASLALILVLNFSSNVMNIIYDTPAAVYKMAANKLYEKYPNEKFAVYDYEYLAYPMSTAMSFTLQFDGKADINGRRIGVICTDKPCKRKYPERIMSDPIVIVTLENEKESSLSGKRRKWIQVNSENLYNDLIGWLNKAELKSNFSVTDYINNKLK